MSDAIRLVPLRDLAISKGLVGGPFGSTLVSVDYVDKGIPVIRGQNLGTSGYFNPAGYVFVTEQKAERDLASNLAKPGDVIFTQRGTLGQVGIVPDEPYQTYVISQSQMRMRVNTELTRPKYIYYCFRDKRMLELINSRAITTGVPHINLGILADLSIPKHSVRTQDSIVGILGALDDKIAVNERVRTISLELLRTYYVQTSKRTHRTVRLDNIVDLCYGKALKEIDRTPGPIPVFGGNGVSGYHDKSLVSGPGIIVGRKGANAGSVSWSQKAFWPIDTAFYVLPVAPAASLEFLFFLLQTVGLTKQVGDSAIPGLNRSIALSCEVSLPDTTEIMRFTDLARPILEAIDQGEDESRVLAELRDTLLPRLISGELRVRDAEKVVEDAV
jgi:type I restriction enzyme S subunit